MHSKSPLLVAGDLGKSPDRHPFEGLPAGLMSSIYTLPDGENLAGTGGMLYYFNHFLQWEGPLAEGAAGGWVLSGTTGAATVTQPNVRQGAIVLTGDATGSVNPTLALGGASAPANFIYAVGKRQWCFARLKLVTVATTELFFGIGTPDTSPCVTGTFPSDGIFFDKASTATKADFHARKDGTSTEKLLVTGTLVDDTYTTLGFIVTAEGHIIPFQDGVAIAAGIIVAGTANIPAVGDPMQFMLGILGASMTCTVDWLLLGQEI